MQQAQGIRAATLAALGHVEGDNDRLGVAVLYPPWAYTAAGQVWECIQGYDSAVYPDIVPGGAAWGTFHRPLHATTPDLARPWVAPTGAHDMYKAGEYMTLDGALWRCLQDTAYSPEEYARAWEVIT